MLIPNFKAHHPTSISYGIDSLNSHGAGVILGPVPGHGSSVSCSKDSGIDRRSLYYTTPITSCLTLISFPLLTPSFSTDQLFSNRLWYAMTIPINHLGISTPSPISPTQSVAT